MANNRMFLVHVPTGLAVCLGKRMSFGWYQSEEYAVGQKINLLYETLERDYLYEGKQDDFAIAIEDSTEAPNSLGWWDYSNEKRDDGLVQLITTNGENDAKKI